MLSVSTLVQVSAVGVGGADDQIDEGMQAAPGTGQGEDPDRGDVDAEARGEIGGAAEQAHGMRLSEVFCMNSGIRRG